MSVCVAWLPALSVASTVRYAARRSHLFGRVIPDPRRALCCTNPRITAVDTARTSLTSPGTVTRKCGRERHWSGFVAGEYRYH